MRGPKCGDRGPETEEDPGRERSDAAPSKHESKQPTNKKPTVRERSDADKREARVEGLRGDPIAERLGGYIPKTREAGFVCNRTD